MWDEEMAKKSQIEKKDQLFDQNEETHQAIFKVNRRDSYFILAVHSLHILSKFGEPVNQSSLMADPDANIRLDSIQSHLKDLQ